MLDNAFKVFYSDGEKERKRSRPGRERRKKEGGEKEGEEGDRGKGRGEMEGREQNYRGIWMAEVFACFPFSSPNLFTISCLNQTRKE